MKTTQSFAVSAMAAAVLLALAGCGGIATRDRNAGAEIKIDAAPAVAQGALPQCDSANYDRVRGLFTVINPAPEAVNQQCLLTVVSAQQASGAQYPAAPFLVEGYYTIELSGGGGGGGGGAARDGGGGGGGAGAAPFKTVRLLSPGVYKLTIGTGGEGGKPGGYTEAGNPTSLTNYNSGELVAGFQGADVWGQHSRAPGSGRGGIGLAGGSSGGDGGDAGSMRTSRGDRDDFRSSDRTEAVAQSGGMLQTPGYTGAPGQAGGESGLTGRRDVVQANAGGGGGAGVGSGGAGDSATGGAAGSGDLGAGGGGGSGHPNAADSGGRGGHGFIRLTLNQAIAQAVVPARVAATPAPAPAPAPASAASTITTPAPAATRPARKDRN